MASTKLYSFLAPKKEIAFFKMKVVKSRSTVAHESEMKCLVNKFLFLEISRMPIQYATVLVTLIATSIGPLLQPAPEISPLPPIYANCYTNSTKSCASYVVASCSGGCKTETDEDGELVVVCVGGDSRAHQPNPNAPILFNTVVSTFGGAGSFELPNPPTVTPGNTIICGQRWSCECDPGDPMGGCGPTEDLGHIEVETFDPMQGAPCTSMSASLP